MSKEKEFEYIFDTIKKGEGCQSPIYAIDYPENEEEDIGHINYNFTPNLSSTFAVSCACGIIPLTIGAILLGFEFWISGSIFSCITLVCLALPYLYLAYYKIHGHKKFKYD